MTTPHTTSDYRYAPMPEDLLYDEHLSDKAVRIFGVLIRHGLDPSSCFPSHERIAEKLHVSARSIQRPLMELVKAGWVEKVRRTNGHGERTSDGYHVYTTRAELRGTTAQKRPLGHRAETSEEGKPSKPVKESKNQGAALNALAREILDDVWAAKKSRGEPVPHNYPAAMKAIEKILAAGHAPNVVKVAALRAVTITGNALEVELNRRSTGQARREDRVTGAQQFLANKQKELGA